MRLMYFFGLLILLATIHAPLVLGISSCQAVQTPGSYGVIADLSGAPIPLLDTPGFACILINSSNVEITCLGTTITGNQTSGTFGIVVYGYPTALTDVVIRDCTILNYSSNVHVLNSSASLSNNTLIDAPIVGLSTHFSEINLSNNYVYNNTNGILVNISNATLENNTACGTTFFGMGMRFQNSNATLTNNTVCRYWRGFSSDSSNTIFLNNTAHNNSERGFYIDDSNSNLSNNIAYNNSDNGFYSIYSEVLFTNNIAYDNNVCGFYSLSDTNSTYIANNASGNFNGFEYERSNSTSIGNLAFENRLNGFSAVRSNLMLTNNTARNNSANGFGISMSSSDLSDNLAFLNGQRGFYLRDSQNSNLTDNFASNNNYGFQLQNLSGNLADNTANNNSITGFFSSQDSDLILVNNLASANLIGFNMSNSTVSFLNNTASNNTEVGFYLYNSIGLYTDNVAYSNYLGFTSYHSRSNYTNNSAYFNSQGFASNLSSISNYLNDQSYSNLNYGFYSNSSNVTLTGVRVYSNNRGIYMRNLVAGIMSNAWAYNNSFDLDTYSSHSDWPLRINNTKFGYSSINLSLDDLVETGYIINSSVAPDSPPQYYVSFNDKYLFSSGQETLDNITFHWSSEDMDGYIGSSIQLFAWNLTDWSEVSNQSLSTYSLYATNVTLMGIPNLGLFAHVSSEQDDSPDEPNPSLSLDVESTESGYLATVTSEDEPVGNVKIFLDGELLGYADGNGQYEFDACGESAVVEAMKSGYESDNETIILLPCAECENNDDCAIDEICSSNICVPVQCSCGEVSIHECLSYDCCSDSDCRDDESCVNHECEQKSTNNQSGGGSETFTGCTLDSDCADDYYCETEKCVPVVGQCGYPSNHVFIEYECGSGEGCSECTVGTCIAYECIVSDLTCPEDGVIGTTTNCTATENGYACKNCNYKVISPDGKTAGGITDENGNFGLPLNTVGTYKVYLIKSGTELAAIEVEATNIQGPENALQLVLSGIEKNSFVFLALILILLIALGIYWRRTRERKKK